VHETGHHGGHTVSTRESGKKVVVHAIQRVLVIKEFNQHVLGPKSLNKRYQGRLTLLLLTQRARASAERIYEVLDTDPDVVERDEALALPGRSGWHAVTLR
jgi:ABC-type multidrug transport system fused ATPase/permease subunit